MQFKIDKGIPMPNPNDVNPRNVRYPWRQLEVGDSFEYRPAGSQVNPNNAHMTAKIASTRHSPALFRARKMPDGSYRIWRVA